MPEQAADDCLVGLASGYDHDSIASAAHPDDGNFDGFGWSYAAETRPTEGLVVLADIVRVPSVTDGASNTVEAHGQDLALAAMRTGALRVLAAAGQGNDDGTAVVSHADGLATTVPLRVTDWAAGRPAFDESVAVAAPNRGRAGQGRGSAQVNIYAHTVPLDSTRTVRSITLPDDQRLKVFALTLERAR